MAARRIVFRIDERQMRLFNVLFFPIFRLSPANCPPFLAYRSRSPVKPLIFPHVLFVFPCEPVSFAVCNVFPSAGKTVTFAQFSPDDLPCQRLRFRLFNAGDRPPSAVSRFQAAPGTDNCAGVEQGRLDGYTVPAKTAPGGVNAREQYGAVTQSARL